MSPVPLERMEVKQRRKPDDLTDVIAQLILSRGREQLSLRVAPGWEKLGWLRRDTLLRLTIMRSLAGLDWDRLRVARRKQNPQSRRAAKIAEPARCCTRSVVACLGLPLRVTQFLAVSRPPPLHEHLTQEFRTVAS